LPKELAENFFVGAYSSKQVWGNLNLKTNSSFKRLHLSNTDYIIQKGLKIIQKGLKMEISGMQNKLLLSAKQFTKLFFLVL
jgi:hypothetical protein